MDWNGKPYHSLDWELKQKFGRKLYKLSVDGGMTCPNRDGTLGQGGCIFCSGGGSGEFAQPAMASVREQIEAAMGQVERKMPKTGPILNQSRYIAYFQAYTNTYAPVPYLRDLFTEAINHPEVAALSIGTRPDCLKPDVIELLKSLNEFKSVWVELGLQTIHNATARLINRCYELDVYEDTFKRLQAAGLTVIVHVILGLPGETREMMLQTIDYLARRPPQGLKLQLLHILKGTALADMYRRDPFPMFSMDEYIDFLIDCVERLPPQIAIHRLTGDGPKSLLMAPAWSGNKRLVLNTLHRRFRERDTWQGKRLTPALSSHSSGETRPSASTTAP